MQKWQGKLLEAYQDGLDAAYRVGKYKDVKEPPECPYPIETKEYDAWTDGFGDGTEDFIACQEA